jgi:hypothetical protein
MQTRFGVGAIAAAALLLSAGTAQAQRVGIQANWADDVDLGLGARVEVDVPELISTSNPFSRTFVIGSFDYFFPDCDECTYWELNANLAFPLVVTGFDPYVGGGLNVAHIDLGLDGTLEDDADTDIGFNLLAGIRFPLQGFTAFGEARYEIAGGEQFVITLGALLGGRPGEE